MKNNKIIIIILSGLLAISIGIIIYLVGSQTKVEKTNDNTESGNITETIKIAKIDESKDYYYTESLGKYKAVYKQNTGEGEKETETDFIYPVVNINSDDAKKFNEEVKTNTKEYFDGFETANNQFESQMKNSNECYGYYNINNKKYYNSHLFNIKAEFELKNEFYLSVNTAYFAYGICCGGYGEQGSTVFNLKDGTKLSNREIIKLFNYDFDKMQNALKEFLKNDKLYDELNADINLETTSLLIKDDKLFVGINVPDATDYIEYNGTSFSNQK